MEIAVKDYIVIKDGRKSQLAQVIKAKPNKITAVLDNVNRSSASSQEVVECDNSDIVANLGANPSSGINVAGVRVEPYIKTIAVKPWGEVHIFRDLTQGEERLFVKALSRVGQKMKKYNLTQYLPIETRVRPPHGKWAGHYRNYGNPDKLPEIHYHPKEMNNLRYTIWHETGHLVWYKGFSKKQVARWIKAYHQGVELSRATSTDLSKLLKEFKSSKLSLAEFYGEFDEEAKERIILDAVYGHIHENHRISEVHLEILYETGDSLEEYWPQTEIELSDIKTIISDYAGTKPEEFWAEAFAFYMTKQKLPPSIKKMVKKELVLIKKR